MEHKLLTPRMITLSHNGIPYKLIHHLLEGTCEQGRYYHDGNLLSGAYGGTDHDIKEINSLEKSLGSLSPEQRDLRVMADFCCIWRYDYPQRVYELCAAVGGNPHTAFCLHYQISAKRRQELIYYAEALKRWLTDDNISDPSAKTTEKEITDRKVFQYLGRKDPLKEILVERTYWGLSARALNCSFWGHNATGNTISLAPYTAQNLSPQWAERMSKLERNIKIEMGEDAENFLCDVGGTAEPACHFKFIRRIDILVSSIGCLSWRGNLPPKDSAVTGRRAITAAYLNILEKYWRGAASAASQMSDSQTAKIEGELFQLLGDQTLVKRWLVASLWKNIKNQTQFHAFPMKRWIEFVRIGESYLNTLS
jgi:hypothetical protein